MRYFECENAGYVIHTMQDLKSRLIRTYLSSSCNLYLLKVSLISLELEVNLSSETTNDLSG
jgi:hypothetical protein